MSLVESEISSSSDYESFTEESDHEHQPASSSCSSSRQSVDLEKAKQLTKFICQLGKHAKAALYKDHHDYLKNYDSISELKNINKKALKNRTPEEEKILIDYF